MTADRNRSTLLARLLPWLGVFAIALSLAAPGVAAERAMPAPAEDAGYTERDFSVGEGGLWEAAFAGDARVTLKRYPELGHLGIVADADDPLASYQRPGKVDDDLIDDVADWIRQR